MVVPHFFLSCASWKNDDDNNSVYISSMLYYKVLCELRKRTDSTSVKKQSAMLTALDEISNVEQKENFSKRAIIELFPESEEAQGLVWTAPTLVHDVLPDRLSVQLCKIAVQKDHRVFEQLSRQLKTRDICLEAVTQWGSHLDTVPEDLRADRQIVWTAVKKNPWALKYADLQLHGSELFSWLVRHYPSKGVRKGCEPYIRKDAMEAWNQAWKLAESPEATYDDASLPGCPVGESPTPKTQS